MTRLLLGLAACGGGGDEAADTDGVAGDDDDDVPPPLTTVPACDDTSFTPIEPEVVLEERPFEDRAALVSIPDAPRAVVFVFHGTNGGVTNLLGPHYVRLWNILGDVDIGLVGLDSADRTNARWDDSRDPEANPDMVALRTLRDALIAEGRMSAATPLFAWGFSNGGAFTADFSAMATGLGWDVRANVVHNSAYGRPPDHPTFFTSAEHDDETPGTRRSYDDAVGAGLDAVFHESLEFPWSPEVMLLNPAYDLAEGQGVFDELVGFGAIDATGARLADVDQVDGLMAYYEASSVLPGADRVTPLLRVAWATHRPTSEFACEERDFMLGYL